MLLGRRVALSEEKQETGSPPSKPEEDDGAASPKEEIQTSDKDATANQFPPPSSPITLLCGMRKRHVLKRERP